LPLFPPSGMSYGLKHKKIICLSSLLSIHLAFVALTPGGNCLPTDPPGPAL